MTKKAKQALEKCIERWRTLSKVKEVEKVKLGTEHCSLCTLFLESRLGSDNDCERCPIRKRTGFGHCNGSGYQEIADAHWLAIANSGRLSPRAEDKYTKACREFRKLAKKFVAFLESLRE